MFSNLKPTFNAPNTSFGFSSNVTPNPFGQTAFGKTPSTGFGAPAPAFGQQTTPLFGQASQHGSLFASAAPTNTFGQTVNAQPTFGSGMFGNAASQPSGSGLFGAANTSTFGQQNKTAGFGFGANTANTGFGFGQSANQVQPQQQSTGLFGQTTSNLFGQSSGGFGTNPANNQVGTVIKFTPVTGTDTMVKGSINQTISTRHHCITCMKEYENKSLEELRWEDYQVNRKGPQQGAQPTGGLFGNMSQPVGTPLFGSGAVATSANTLFGQQENKSVFGQTATATGFGQATPAFGATPTSNTGAGLFGKPLTGFGTATTSSAFPFTSTAQPNNLFGSNTAAKPAFGVSSQPNSLFGQPSGFGNQSTFGTFGQTTNQNVGLFNQNKTTPFSILPTSTSNSFGSFAPAAQNTSSLFSGAKPNTGGFGFGQTSSAPVFGQPTFGQANQGGLFNSSFNKTATPLFGQTQTTNTLGTGLQMGGGTSLFGSTVNKPNTMFGNNLGLFNSGFGTSTNTGAFNMGGAATQPGVPNQDQNHINTEQHIINMSSTPYGIPSLLNNIYEIGTDLKDCTRPTNPGELKALLNTVTKTQQTLTPTEKLKPVQVFGRKVPMFDGLEHRDESLISNLRINTNPKRLIIRNHPNKNKESLDDTLIRSTSIPILMDKDLSTIDNRTLIDVPKEKETLYPDLRSLQNEMSTTQEMNKKANDVSSNTSLDISTNGNPPISSTMIKAVPKALFLSDTINEDEDSRDEEADFFAEASESQDWQTDNNDSSIRGVTDNLSTASTDSLSPTGATTTTHPTGVILTRPEYYTVPSLEELVKYISEDGSCVVQGFTVGRYGYGNVYFSEAFDVSNLNLDELVHFRHKEINIYPDDSKKPPVGQGLNRRAQVTLDKVWPLDKKAKVLITDIETLMKMDYAGRLRKLSEKQNARFMEYRPDTGSWVFKVEHFSKYGQLESDDDDETDVEQLPPGLKPPTTTGDVVTTVTTPAITTVAVTTGKTTVTTTVTSTITSAVVSPSEENFELRDIVDAVEQVDESDLFVGLDNYSVPQGPSRSAVERRAKCSLMKSTFFEDDAGLESYDNTSDVCSSEGGILELSNYVSQSSPKRTETEVDKSGIPESEYLPLSIFMDDVPEPLDKPEVVELIPVDRSQALTNNMYCLADMTLFRGRSFKVGWTKQSTLICLANNDFFCNVIAFKQPTLSNTNAFQNLEEHLECQFKNSATEERTGIPFRFPMYSNIKLHAHQEIANSLPRDNYEKQIWDLIATLFDYPELEEGVKCKTGRKVTEKYRTKIEKLRKQDLSRWIKSVVESSVDSEVNTAKKSEESKILSYISGNKIIEASKLAMQSGNCNLSLLISQLPTPRFGQVALQTQLNMWDKCDVYDHLDESILKIYAILSGKAMVEVRGKQILTYEGMNWIRSLAIYFWYVIKREAPLSDAVNLYEKMFEEYKLALPPSPDYANAPENIHDLRFQLLKYYSDNSYPLTHLLNTFTYTDDPLDYRLSWFVFQTLQALNQDEVSVRVKNHMHINFAVQLEQMGLWHWAAYILTFLEDNFLKKNMIINLVSRHLKLPDEATPEYKIRERMLVNEFNIPKHWMEHHRALRAIQRQKYKEAVYYYCFAYDWDLASEIIMNKLVPDHLLTYDYEYLVDLLTPLSKHKELLPNWEEEGGLILDFAKLGVQYNHILSLHDPEAINKQLISFRSAVINVSIRFKHFVPMTYLHDVCLAEMSGRIAVMLRKLLTIISGHTYELCVDTAINAQTLPMTSDYLKQELNSILIDFLNGNQPMMIYL